MSSQYPPFNFVNDQNEVVASNGSRSPLPATNRHAWRAILARKHDQPPGNMVVWRGMTRLHDMVARSPGNAVFVKIGDR